MKKIILTTVLTLTISFINAQNKKDMSFGIKGGLNISSVSNVEVEGVSSSSLAGFHAGFFGEFMISDKFAIQPEVLYSTQGVKLEFDGGKGDLKVDYIIIPVLVKYYVADAFSLEFGPQIGFLVSAEAKAAGESMDIKDEVKSTDISLDFGAGYNITTNLMLGVRYNLGLTRVQKDMFSGESESKNSVFQIFLGYKF
jgi:hypothetical protein